jgi:hypothetical protein
LRLWRFYDGWWGWSDFCGFDWCRSLHGQIVDDGLDASDLSCVG